MLGAPEPCFPALPSRCCEFLATYSLLRLGVEGSRGYMVLVQQGCTPLVAPVCSRKAFLPWVPLDMAAACRTAAAPGTGAEWAAGAAVPSSAQRSQRCGVVLPASPSPWARLLGNAVGPSRRRASPGLSMVGAAMQGDKMLSGSSGRCCRTGTFPTPFWDSREVELQRGGRLNLYLVLQGAWSWIRDLCSSKK